MKSNLQDRVAIEELKYKYAYATDAVDKEAFLDVFTDDAYFDIGVYGSGRGEEDLEDFIDWLGDLDYEVRAHNVFNPIIDIDGNRASGKWYYIVLYRSPNGDIEMGQGLFNDEYHRVDGEWLIASLSASRRITTQF